MLKILNKQKGVTLIELMIVVIIIGVLAAIAIPRFAAASTSSKQSEAKVNLKQMYTAQRSYLQDMVLIGFPVAEQSQIALIH